MKQTDAERLDKLAEEYRTHADILPTHGGGSGIPSFKEEWVLLTVAWTKLAEEAQGRSRPT